MNNQKIAVIDHKCANLHSVIKALEIFKIDVKICTSKTELKDIDGIILPGVGSFDPAMKNLIKQDLVDYAKRYYPNSFKDFNKASFGALMLDTVAYVGDILSFYLDYQANESFLDTASEFENVIRHGRSLGYKYDPNPSSYGDSISNLL